MSDNHVKMGKTTPVQFVGALLGGLFAPLLAIILIVIMVVHIQQRHDSAEPLSNEPAAVEARIKPVGDLKIVDASAVHVDMTGEQVFNAVCTACHTPGALGAPKFGNKADWAPRIKKGYDTLIDHALHGFNNMPARGGNPDLTDLEIKRAIAYMANAGGAHFVPPEPAAPAAAPAAAAPAAAAPAAAAPAAK